MIELRNWRKSSYSQGSDGCVEVGSANWRKSSHSQGQNGCVEVGASAAVIGVRDTKLGPAGPILTFSHESWSAFVGRAKETN